MKENVSGCFSEHSVEQIGIGTLGIFTAIFV